MQISIAVEYNNWIINYPPKILITHNFFPAALSNVATTAFALLVPIHSTLLKNIT